HSFYFSSRRRHTRSKRDWSSDVCSSDLGLALQAGGELLGLHPVLEGLGVAAVELPLHLLLEGVGLHHLHRREHLGGPGGQGALRSEERRVGEEGRWRGRRAATGQGNERR